MINTLLKTAPTVEPVSLQEMKEWLRLNSGSFSDNLTSIQSIAPGSHAITAIYALIGAYTDVLGLSAVVVLDSGINGVTGTVDIKIQESDDHVTWTDWTGGAFTQVTEANDNTIYEKAYTGSKQYIRVVGQVLLAACEFGVQIAKYSSDVTDDALLTSLIIAGRQYVEAYTRRQIITATWYYYLDIFPNENYIKLPYGKLQSISSIAYKNSSGTTTPMILTTDYLVDTNSDPGRIVLPFSVSWPSFTAYSVNPITIEYICGYGLAVSVPDAIKTAIKLIAADMYENRQKQDTQQLFKNDTAENLLYDYRLWEF